MLSHADNELLTRIGPGTPMGNLLRQYWIPVVFPDAAHAGVGHGASRAAELPLARHSQSGQPGEIWKPNDGPNGFRSDTTHRPCKNDWPIADMSNDFQIDRAIQRTRTYTGIPTVGALERGTVPPGVVAPESYRKRSAAQILPNEVDWITALRDWHAAETTEVV